MSWMARCDELGDRREPVGLGNSVGSNVDAALTFKAVHGRVVNEPPDRAARERELDAVTELRRVNLSPENRFEASALRGNSTATGTFRRHLWCACAQSTLVAAAPAVLPTFDARSGRKPGYARGCSDAGDLPENYLRMYSFSVGASDWSQTMHWTIP